MGKNNKLWERWSEHIHHHARLILGTALLLTIFFTFGLTKLQFGTHLKEFHRWDSRDLIETIENYFNEADYMAVLFESKTDQSMFSVDLLQEQLKVMHSIKNNFDVKTQSLAEGIDEGLRRNRDQSLQEVKDYSIIAETIIALSGPKTVKDLTRLTQHYLSHPEAIDFYTKFRVAAARSPTLPGAGSKSYFSIPHVKAVSATVRLAPSYSPEERQKVFVRIRDLIEKMSLEHLNVHLYAAELITHDIDSHMQENSLLMALILFFLDSILLWMTFKKGREVYLTLFIILTAGIWTFGAAGWLGIRISYLHSMVLPILLGTGIDDSVVFGRRFAEEQKTTSDFLQVLRKTYSGTGSGIFFTTFTTFVAFGVASFASSTQALFSFCGLVSLSMILVFILTVLLQGSLRSELNKRIATPKNGPVIKQKNRWVNLLNFLNRFLEWPASLGNYFFRRHPRQVLFASSLFFLFSIFLMTRLDSDFDARLFMKKSMPIYAADQLEDKYFGNRFLGYILIEGNVTNPEVLKKIKTLKTQMNDLPLLVRTFDRVDFVSILDLIEKSDLRGVPESNIEGLFDKFASDHKTANYVTGETYQELFKNLIHKGKKGYDALQIRYLIKLKDRETDAKKALGLYDSIKQKISDSGLDRIPGISIRVGGGEFANIIEQKYYFRSFIYSFLISLLINCLILFLFWKNIWESLTAIIPLCLAIGITMSLMALLDVKLNVLNLCIGTIVVGLGIDYPIHLLERFKQEKIKDTFTDDTQAMHASLSSMAPPLFGSALTTIVGFASATVLAMPMAESFGIFTGLAVLLAYLGTIILLPIILTKSWKMIIPRRNY